LLKVSGAQNGGAFDLAELVTPPGWHRLAYVDHERDELFYVVDGDYEARLDDQPATVPLPTGASLFVPRGVQRSLRRTRPGTGRLLLMRTPGHAPDPADTSSGIEFVHEFRAPGRTGSAHPLPT
jgi:mannose-6-phosphate isomerase-like protein (cupin superfamily)